MSALEWESFKEEVEKGRRLSRGMSLYHTFETVEPKKQKKMYLHSLEDEEFDAIFAYVVEKEGPMEEFAYFTRIKTLRKKVPFASCFPN